MEIKYRFQTPRSYYGLIDDFKTMKDMEMIIFYKLFGQTYYNPVRVRIQYTTDDFVVCKTQSGRTECFKYTDFYCGDLIYDILGVG